jgi:hypothetical protein
MTAKAPERDLFPLLRPYFSAWLVDAAAGLYLSNAVSRSPIWMASADPTAALNPTTGAALPPGSMVSGTDGLLYVANSSGVPTVQPTLAGANTWTALQTFGAGAAFLDGDTIAFGTPGTDLVLTPDGTNVVVTGTGKLVFADSVETAWGTGVDLQAYHDGTDSWLTSATGNLVIDNTSATGHTYLDLGTNTSATSVAVRNNSGTTLLDVRGDGLITQPDGTILQRTGAGSGTGDVIERIGATTLEGLEVRVYEQTVTPAAIETALITLPTNHVVDSVQANCQAALTGGGTTVTWGIGITGDVDAYGSVGIPTDSLLKNGKINAMGTKAAGAGASVGVFSATTAAVKLIGAATGGTSAGNTALTVGSVRVVIRYRVLVSLTDAP